MTCSSPGRDARAAALGLACVLAGPAARAEDAAEPPPAADAPSEEIVVFGDLEVAMRRAELDRDLRRMGYEEGRRKDGKTVYRPVVAWQPSVVVHDDGFVVLKRSPVRFGVPKGVNPWWNLACPIAIHVCVRPGGQVVSPRKLGQAKGRVAMAIEPELDAWREAVVERAMDERVNDEIPVALDALWYEGIPLDPRAPPVATPEARRRAILELWSSRACTPEGDRVRDAVAAFLAREVQASPFPLSPGEVENAVSACTCGRTLDLGPETAPAP